MARVDVAYVEVRPDLTGFGTALKARLDAINVSEKVRIDADFSQMISAVQRVARLRTKAAQEETARANEAMKADEARAKHLASVSMNMYRTLAKDRIRLSETVRRAEFAAYREYAKREKELTALVRRRATSAARPYQKIASMFSGRGPISAGVKFIFGSIGGLTSAVGVSVAKMFTTISTAGVKVFTNLAEKASELFGTGEGPMGAIGKAFGSLAASAGQAGPAIAAVAGPVGAIASGFVAVAAAAILATVALGTIQLVLGALLAVVIPLVAGITALVAAFVQLGAVGLGGLALLPGALAVGVAAFGPLLLVMEKFQDLITRTKDRVGPLYEVFERLKNAMFAVISSGLIEALKDLAVTVLPKLVPGIIAVASAWNRLFLGAAKFASTAGAIEGMNALLQIGAKFVNAMADAAQRFGPVLLNAVTASLPAIQGLLSIATQLAGEFGAWIASMLKSGQLQTLFNQIGLALGMISLIARQVGPYLVGFLTAVLPPAIQFLSIVGALAERWAGFMQSAEGQQLISDFLTSMNSIIIDLVPLVEQLFLMFLNLGPTFETLNAAATPALMAIVDILYTLIQQIAPAVQIFLDNFTASLQNPATKEAIDRLGGSIELLFTSLSENQDAIKLTINLFAFMVTVIGLVVQIFSAFADVLQWVIDKLDALGDKLGKFGLPLKLIAGQFGVTQEEAKDTGTAMGSMATNTTNAVNTMGRGLSAVASTRSWSQIQASSKATAEYMVDMANNGITGNKALIESMAKLAAAAYATKNEYDMTKFENLVGRAYTGATGGLYRINLTGFRNAGSAAGSAWGTGWNDAVDSSIKTSVTKQKKKKPYLSNMKPLLKSLDPMTLIRGGKAYDTGREIATYLAKGITSGSANIKKASNYIYKHYRTNLNQILTGVKNFNKNKNAVWKFFTKKEQDQFKKITTAKDMDAFLKTVKGRYQDLLEDIQGFKADVAGVLTAKRGMVNYFGFIPTPAEVKTQLDEQLANIKKFTQGVAALQAKGIDPALAREWIMAGPETAGNIVEGLQNATAAEIRGINSQYTAIGTEANRFAEQQASIYFGVGEATVKGVISGIASMQTALNTEIAKAMKTAVEAAKAALKVKSPSKIFDSIGVDTMLGYIQGVQSKTNATVGAIDSIYGSVTKLPPPQLSTPTLAKPNYVAPNAMAGAGAGQQPVNVKVYLGTRELTDIIKVEVNGYDQTRARALLTGRR